MPALEIVQGLKGTLDYYWYMGVPVCRRWPRAPLGPRSLDVRRTNAVWQLHAPSCAALRPYIEPSYRMYTSGTGLTWRDLYYRLATNGYAWYRIS